MKKLFSFSLPPVLNEQIAANRTSSSVGAKQKKLWTGKIAGSAIMQNPERCRFEKPWIVYEFVVRTRAYDPDGLEATQKFLLDGLVKAGILKNDNLTIIQSPAVHFFSVDPSLSKADEFVNVLLLSEPPFSKSFASLVGLPQPTEDEEAAACA